LLKFKNKKGSDLMKNFKRMLSLLLAVVMVIGISAFTFADDETTYSITVKDSTSGKTYQAYQIFAGTINEDGDLVISGWGSGIDSNTSLNYTDYVEQAEAATANTDLANDFARELLKIINTPTKETSSLTNNTYVIAGLETGYYLVKASDGTATLALLKLVNGDIDVTPKTGTPTFVKKVMDVNDTTAEKSGWQDSADYDIGDDVPFQLTATLGNDVEYYNAYPVEFKDTLSEGLTYNYGIKVMLDGKTDVTKWFTVKVDGQNLTIFTKDAKAFDATNNSTIVVTYNATLNEQAVIGSDGNPNTAQLVYANNPNVTYPVYSDDTKKTIETSTPSEDEYKKTNPSGGDDEANVDDQKAPDDYTSEDETNNGGTPTTSESVKDTVIVFTYKVVINKYDENMNALAGATFVLEKQLSDGSTKEITAVTDKDGVVFTFSGLDDGTYVIKETETPDNYNAISDITFEISAEHDTTADTPTLTKLNGIEVNADDGTITLTEGQDATVDTSNGTITANIQNFKGSTLPETGGMGTKLFYVFGGLLVLGASILLITKKRMNNI
jgi:fimbrial isopeptide formation D2 family protein/LPXTG-motif cell wall-anchored protein